MATTKNAFDIGNAATFLEEVKKLIVASGGYTLIKEEDGVITIGIEKEEDYVEGWQDAYLRIDTNEDKSS
ncbi:MAG: hypothetical protein LUD72_07115, partial [Bacteroidales bacterium]|nr:hypothetical protein [Bacteroidales bacterium]